MFSGTGNNPDDFSIGKSLPVAIASVRAVAALPDSVARFDMTVFTVNLSFGATNNGAETDMITGD